MSGMRYNPPIKHKICVLHNNTKWTKWANNWLSGQDKSAAVTADANAYTAYAADAAVYATKNTLFSLTNIAKKL